MAIADFLGGNVKINLQNLLKYKNEKVISRYQIEYPHSIMSGEEALVELLKYIWLCHKHSLDKKLYPKNNSLNFDCVIHIEMEDIDNMWHTFLLFTRDYHEFCNTYLNGVFFHHDPISAGENNISKKTYEKELNNYLSYICENLGENTLIKWFNP